MPFDSRTFCGEVMLGAACHSVSRAEPGLQRRRGSIRAIDRRGIWVRAAVLEASPPVERAAERDDCGYS